MRLWNGHHERNALDMRSLANELGVQDDIIYAGFSAGALAAVLAADNDTRAILALDPVDQEAMAVQAIRNLSTPLIGFSGPPSSCNANGNAEPLFTARSEQYLSRNTVLPAASHCSFESPSDWLCELVCEGGESLEDAHAQRETVIRQTVEAVLSVSTRSATGLEPVSDS
jgi:dienelactone hydrolase